MEGTPAPADRLRITYDLARVDTQVLAAVVRAAETAARERQAPGFATSVGEWCLDELLRRRAGRVQPPAAGVELPELSPRGRAEARLLLSSIRASLVHVAEVDAARASACVGGVELVDTLLSALSDTSTECQPWVN